MDQQAVNECFKNHLRKISAKADELVQLMRAMTLDSLDCPAKFFPDGELHEAIDLAQDLYIKNPLRKYDALLGIERPADD
jgi:hypothetical protein